MYEHASCKQFLCVHFQRKGTAKVSALLQIEEAVQERWKMERVFEEDADNE